MSLPFIAETAAEVHRLAIAGSNLAADDFRLKKLVPSLETVAAKAPIFGRIATAVKAVTEEKDASVSGRALLDLSSLLTAIQYTQSPHEVKGDLTLLTSEIKEWKPTTVSHRSLAAVINALTSTGEGRVEIVRDALERGLFQDLRLMAPAVTALSDNYGEMSDLAARKVVPAFGSAVVPLLLAGFNPKGGNTHARRITALCKIDPAKGRSFCRSVLDEATKEVKLAVIEGLTGSIEDLDTILELAQEKTADVRRAAISALSGISEPKVIDFIRKSMKGKDYEVVSKVAVSLADEELEATVLAEAEKVVATITGTTRGVKTAVDKDLVAAESRFSHLLDIKDKQCSPRWIELAIAVFKHDGDGRTTELSTKVAEWLYRKNDAQIDTLLYEQNSNAESNRLIYCMAAAARRLSPAKLYDRFAEQIFVKNSKYGSPAAHLLSGRWFASHSEHHSLTISDLGKELDPRWLATAVKEAATDIVLYLARPGDKHASEFIRSLKALPHYPMKFVDCLLKIDPENAFDFIKRLIKENLTSKSHRYYIGMFIDKIAEVPAEQLPEVEAFKTELPADHHDEMDTAIAQLRHKAAQAAQAS